MGVGIVVLAWLAAATVVAPQDGGAAYEAHGRRDPFASGGSPAVAKHDGGKTACPSGLSGFAVAQVALKGTVLTKGTYVAVLTGPDGKTYTARAGQPLYDARIVAISAGRATVQLAPDAKAGIGARVVELTLAH